MNTYLAPQTFGDCRAAFQMRGDAMEPAYRSRDLLLIDTSDTAASGGDFLLWFEDRGDYAVRRVERTPGGKLRLTCVNARYSAEEVEPGAVEIAGRVCGLWRDGGL